MKNGRKNFSGCIFFSASGVTKKVGKEIARIVEGDFFEIVPKEIYTDDDEVL